MLMVCLSGLVQLQIGRWDGERGLKRWFSRCRGISIIQLLSNSLTSILHPSPDSLAVSRHVWRTSHYMHYTLAVSQQYLVGEIWFIYIYVCVCVCVWIPLRVHRIHPVGSKANESLRRMYTSIFGGDEMVDWFKALNFLRSDRCCPRIESTKGSFFHHPFTHIHTYSVGWLVCLS